MPLLCARLFEYSHEDSHSSDGWNTPNPFRFLDRHRTMNNKDLRMFFTSTEVISAEGSPGGWATRANAHPAPHFRGPPSPSKKINGDQSEGGRASPKVNLWVSRLNRARPPGIYIGVGGCVARGVRVCARARLANKAAKHQLNRDRHWICN